MEGRHAELLRAKLVAAHRAVQGRNELTAADTKSRPLQERVQQQLATTHLVEQSGAEIKEALAMNAAAQRRAASLEERIAALRTQLNASITSPLAIVRDPDDAAPVASSQPSATGTKRSTSLMASSLAGSSSCSDPSIASATAVAVAAAPCTADDDAPRGFTVAPTQRALVNASGAAFSLSPHDDAAAGSACAARQDHSLPVAPAVGEADRGPRGTATTAGLQVAVAGQAKPAPSEAAQRHEEFVAAMKVKRGQFVWRIDKLSGEAASRGERYISLMERRVMLRKVLAAADVRHRELVAELNALEGFTGRHVESSVLHGQSQRFETPRLLDLLRLEIAELWDNLTDSRKGLVEVTLAMERESAERSALEDAIRERRAALQAFDRNFGARGRMLTVLYRITAEGAGRAFRSWRAFVAVRKESRAALRRVVQISVLSSARFAWKRWLRFVRVQRASEMEAEGGDGGESTIGHAHAGGGAHAAPAGRVGGIGEKMLTYALAQRSAVAENSISLLSWLRRLDGSISASDATLQERSEVRDVSPLQLLAAAQRSLAAAAVTSTPARRGAPRRGFLIEAPVLPTSAEAAAAAGLASSLHDDGVTPALGPAYNLTQPLRLAAALSTPLDANTSRRGTEPGGGSPGAPTGTPTANPAADGAYTFAAQEPPQLAELEDGIAGLSVSQAAAAIASVSMRTKGTASAVSGLMEAGAIADVLTAAAPVPGSDADAALAAVIDRAQRAERVGKTPAEVRAQRKAAERVRSLGASAVDDPAIKPTIDRFLKLELDRAETLLSLGDPGACLAAAKRCEMVFGYRRDAEGLLAVYRLLSRLLEKMSRFDLALIHWGRCDELAKETGNPLAVGEAAEGMGRCLAGRGDHAGAMVKYAAAEALLVARNDTRARMRLLRLRAASLRLTGRESEAEVLEEEVARVDGRLAATISEAGERLAELQRAVFGLGLGDSRLLPLEVCGGTLPLLRQQERFLRLEARKLRAVWRATRDVRNREAGAVKALAAELTAADATGAPTMVSYALPAYYTGSEAGGGLSSETPTTTAGQTESPARRRSSGGCSAVGEELPIEELRQRLAEALSTASADAQEAGRELTAVWQRHANTRGEIAMVKRSIASESGPLSRGAHAGRPLRCLAFNAANGRSNDILGLAPGGAPFFGGVGDASVFAFSTVSGECVSSFSADALNSPFAAPVGHTGPVTCVCLFGDVLYTGSQDCTVRAWDIGKERGYGKFGPVEAEAEREERARADAALRAQEMATAVPGAASSSIVIPKLRDPEEMRRKRAGVLLVMSGHGAPVVCVAAHRRIVLSGAADSVVHMWDPTTGACLRKLRGHTKSVLCMALDQLTFATGGADHGVRLWVVDAPSARNFARAVTCRWRSEEHAAPVTALACVGRDVASGSADGEIFLWNDLTGAPLRRITGSHGGRSVLGLQFDATKIVSIGADCCLVVWDMLSGASLQTFTQPHGGARIAALQYDDMRLMTAGTDRSLRVWLWRGAKPVPQGRTVVVAPGDTLPGLAIRYSIKGKQLLKWNGFPARSLRAAGSLLREGMRLVVGPPTMQGAGMEGGKTGVMVQPPAPASPGRSGGPAQGSSDAAPANDRDGSGTGAAARRATITPLGNRDWRAAGEEEIPENDSLESAASDISEDEEQAAVETLPSRRTSVGPAWGRSGVPRLSSICSLGLSLTGKVRPPPPGFAGGARASLSSIGAQRGSLLPFLGVGALGTTTSLGGGSSSVPRSIGSPGQRSAMELQSPGPVSSGLGTVGASFGFA